MVAGILDSNLFHYIKSEQQPISNPTSARTMIWIWRVRRFFGTHLSFKFVLYRDKYLRQDINNYLTPNDYLHLFIILLLTSLRGSSMSGIISRDSVYKGDTHNAAHQRLSMDQANFNDVISPQASFRKVLSQQPLSQQRLISFILRNVITLQNY